jgi:hypothetical protein
MPAQWQDLFSSAAFEIEALPGFYGRWNHPVLRAITYCMDAMIAIMGKRGFLFAPSFMVAGKKMK